MIRTNFLKRLESSAHSLAETLGRTVGKIGRLAPKNRPLRTKTSRWTCRDTLPDDDEDDEEFLVNRARNPYHLRELDLSRWKADLLTDRETLAAAWEKVRGISPDRDGKLRKIRAHIRNRVLSPSTDKDGRVNRKIFGVHDLQGYGGISVREPGEFGERTGVEHGDSLRGRNAHYFRRQQLQRHSDQLLAPGAWACQHRKRGD